MKPFWENLGYEMGKALYLKTDEVLKTSAVVMISHEWETKFLLNGDDALEFRKGLVCGYFDRIKEKRR